MPDGEKIQNDPIIQQRTQMLQRQAEAEAVRLEQAALHQAAQEERAAQKARELAELMGMLKEPEQRIIRLEAFKLVMGLNAVHTLYGAQKQLMLDEKTLELAKYAILGEV